MNAHSKHKKTGAKKKYAVIVAAVAVVLVIVVAAELTRLTDFYSRTPKTATRENESAINYDPPTEEEREAGDKQKENIPDQAEDTPAVTPATATVTITGAWQNGGVIEVTAAVTDVYKDGTCTFKLEQAGSIVTKDTTAYRDVSSVICNNPLIPRTQFPATGDWVVTVTYTSSDGATGRSESRTIKIE